MGYTDGDMYCSTGTFTSTFWLAFGDNAFRQFMLFKNKTIISMATDSFNVWSIARNIKFGIQTFIFNAYVYVKLYRGNLNVN